MTGNKRSNVVQQPTTSKIISRQKHGAPGSRLSIRTAPDGRKFEWHPTKGFRRYVKSGTVAEA